MNTRNKSEIAEFEPARVEIITFEAKTDIICASPIVGEEDEF